MPAIRFYKTLDDNDYLEKIAYCRKNLKAFYVKDENTDSLSVKSTSESTFRVTDPEHNWNIESDGLIFQLNFSLNSLSILFGAEGIVPDDALLGIGVICTSTFSDRLDAFQIKTFDHNVKNLEVTETVSLPKGNYNGNLIFKIVLYLSSCKYPVSGFPHQSGTILGQLDTFIIDIYKENLLFPVFEADYPEQPLWWVNCQWVDIEYDLFIKENISIIINKSSKDYNKIQKEGSAEYNPGYLAEIMASAIQLIIEKIRSSPKDWEKLMSEQDYAPGTIVNIIQYMRSTFEWDFTSPEKLAKDLRTFTYKALGC